MRMKSIVFVVRDNFTGGFVSSLSSLYNAIKADYDIQVLQLSSMGNASNSFKEKTILPWRLCDYYYSDYTLSSGWKKFFVALVRILAKIDKKLERKIARHYQKMISQADCVVAFSEGPATSFCQYLQHPNKVAWIHHDITHYPKSEAAEKCLEKYNKIVCVAETIANGMQVMYPDLKEKIIAIHNIVDEDRIRNLAKKSIVEKCNNCLTIVSVGRLVPVKRFEIIPMLAKQLIDRGLVFKWWIIGPASDENIILKIQKNIDKYKTNGYVKWIGSRRNPYPYIAKADLLVSTSYTEACPMIFTEARVLDTPIVSADFLTANEFLENGKDGVVSSIDNMAENIYRLLTDSEYRQLIRKNSLLRGVGNCESVNRMRKLFNKQFKE